MTDAAKLRLDNKIAGKALGMIRDRSYCGSIEPPKVLVEFSCHLNDIADAILGGGTVDAETIEVLAVAMQKANNLAERPSEVITGLWLKRIAGRILVLEDLQELLRNRTQRFADLVVSTCPRRRLRRTG